MMGGWPSRRWTRYCHFICDFAQEAKSKVVFEKDRRNNMREKQQTTNSEVICTVFFNAHTGGGLRNVLYILTVLPPSRMKP
jgi:hypothetical protein